MIIMMIVSHEYSVSYLNIMVIIDDKYHGSDDYIYLYDIRLCYYYILDYSMIFFKYYYYTMLRYLILLMYKGI